MTTTATKETEHLLKQVLENPTPRLTFKPKNLRMTRDGSKTETRRAAASITSQVTGRVHPDELGWFHFPDTNQYIQYKNGVTAGSLIAIPEPFYHLQKWADDDGFFVLLQDIDQQRIIAEVDAELFGRFKIKPHKLQPGLFMAKEFTRTVVRVTDIYMERLKAISAESVVREGFTPTYIEVDGQRDGPPVLCQYEYMLNRKKHVIRDKPARAYWRLWDLINRKPELCSAANPWVFAIRYEVVCK